ncbi:WXG100 family type VII secretion target [Aspergillus stella-maris]|uniref:WXG100 family type VII secretion target n=1 Tax=Aspergillus stella-maris TaxID=1810926 RepID=UPI003CCDF8E9
MHFSKLAPVALFAALATASPIPSPQISVDQGQLQQFAATVQSFASSTSAGISEIGSQASVISGSFTGSASLQQQISALNAAGNEIQQAAAALVEAVNSASSSFSETEQDLASSWSRRDFDTYKNKPPTVDWTRVGGSQGETNTGVEQGEVKQAETSVDSIKESDSQGETNTGVENQDVKNGGSSVEPITGTDSQGETKASDQQQASQQTETGTSDYNVGVPVSGEADASAAASSQGEALSAGSANSQGTAPDAYNVGVPVSGTAYGYSGTAY